MKRYLITIYLTDDTNPELLTTEKIEKMIDTIKWPSDYRVTGKVIKIIEVGR